MKPSENRKKKGPELEPVFVAGPDAFAADYTDFSRLLLLPFRSPRHPFTILGTARRLRWSGICDYLSYLRLKPIGIEPQMAQMTQISRTFLPPLIRAIPACRRLGAGRRAVRGSFGLLSIPSITAGPHAWEEIGEPQRHGDTKGEPQKMDQPLTINHDPSALNLPTAEP